jgi:hypothetical protein
MSEKIELALELQVLKWLNSESPITLESLQGKVVAIFAFQMLCPGCVEHSIPQAKKVYTLFPNEDLVVLGLHTVFEHHAAMTEVSLKAFLHEYRIPFPVAIDLPSVDKSPLPETMKSYQLGGTPSLILVDKRGQLRKVKMGHEQDLILGAELMTLLNETL